MVIAAELISGAKGSGRRGTARHEIKLRVRGSRATGNVSDVLIRNLSATGILLETAAELRVGETIAVDLPETDRAPARIVWASGHLLGCAFDRPLSDAAVSAAQLRSEPRALSDERLSRLAAETGQPGSTFGETIRRIRQDRGLSLVEFARKMGVSRPTVWAWEAGKSSPRPRKRQLLQKVLEVTEDELRGLSEATYDGDPPGLSVCDDGTLRSVIGQAKDSIAAVAGTTSDKVTVIIEI